MSTTTVARPAPPARDLGPHWRRSFDMTMGMCLYVAKWFLLVMVVLGVAATLVYAYYATPQVSIVQFGRQAGLWFAFSLMIMCGVLTPALVMNGITRTGVAVGSLLTALGLAALFSAGLVGLLLLERPLFAALGWRAGLPDDAGVLATTQWPDQLLGLFLLYCAGNVSGLLVHAAYYRLGGLKGTVALPLTLSPLLLVAVLGTRPQALWGSGQDVLPGDLDLDLGAWHPVLAVAIVAVAALVHLRLTRTLTLAPKES